MTSLIIVVGLIALWLAALLLAAWGSRPKWHKTGQKADAVVLTHPTHGTVTVRIQAVPTTRHMTYRQPMVYGRMTVRSHLALLREFIDPLKDGVITVTVPEGATLRTAYPMGWFRHQSVKLNFVYQGDLLVAEVTLPA
jgi:hypothetical protein